MENLKSVVKIEDHRKKIFEGVAIEKSEKEFVVPSHRKTTRFSTIEGYVSFLKEHSWSFKDFVENGYCRDQILFFNFVLKGKLTVTKEQFVEDYCVNFVPLEQIEKKYGIPRGLVTFVRDYFGIKRIGANGLKRGKEEIDLSEIQKQVIYGSLLGDCYRFGNGVAFKQSIVHESYLTHIFEIFKQHCVCEDVRKIVSYDDRYNTKNVTVSFYTRNHSQIKSICNEFYVNDIKTINKNILDKLTALSVAYWFMDDGLSEIIKNGDDGRFYSFGGSRIYTCSFTYEENVLLKNWFMEKFDISCVIKFKNKNMTSPYLLFYVSEANKLRNIIRPFVVDSMLYKVDYEKAIERYKRDNSDFDLSKLPAGERYANFDDKNKKDSVNTVFEHYRKSGFPYFNLDEESLNISFERILNWKKLHLYSQDGKTIKYNPNSVNMIWNFQKHIFDISARGFPTPIQIFNDDHLLKSAIDSCLTNVGVCSHENIRAFLKELSGNNGSDHITPSTAKAVYTYFDRPLSVLDFSAGFGGRLLGAMASENVKRYVGIDPLKQTCDGLNVLYEKFKDLSYPSVSIVNGLPEAVLDSINETFDLVFTSPPFFDKEIYSKDNGQSCIKYYDYKDWLNNWLMVVVDKSTSKLNNDGKLVIWIGHSDEHNIIEDFLVASHNILSLDDVLYFEMPESTYNRRQGDSYRLEKFLIMSRKKV